MRIFYLTIILCFALGKCFAIDNRFYVSENLRVNSTDLLARLYPRVDANNDTCAVIRVTSTIKGLKFKNAYIIGDVVYDKGDYIIYMAAGAKKIRVQSADGAILPLDIPFSDYGIKSLQAKTAYKMGISTQVHYYFGKLSVQSTPSDATVFLNDSLIGNTPLQQEIQVGQYRLRIERQNYASINEILTITKDSLTDVKKRLERNTVNVTIVSDPQTEIVLDGEKVAKGRYEGTLMIGNHDLAYTYRSLQETTTINIERDSLVQVIEHRLLGILEKDYSKSNVPSSEKDVAVCKGNCITDKEVSLSENVTEGLLGKYRITFHKEGYWKKHRRVVMEPGKRTVVKVPKMYQAKGYVFLSYLYSPKADVGLMFGVCGRAGGYISGRYNIGANGFSKTKPEDNVFGINSWSANGGIMIRFCQELFFYAGAGYGAYDSKSSYFKQSEKEYQGVNVEGGLILNMHGKKGKGFTLTIGYNTQADKSFIMNTSPLSNAVVGIGMAL